MTARHFFNGLFTIAGIVWILLTDREQRHLYNQSIGYDDDDGED